MTRLKQIVETLMAPQNKVVTRLKRAQLLEKTALIYLMCEDWPDYIEYRYQPRSVAASVAWAESQIAILSSFQNEKADAKKQKKEAHKRLKRQINGIESTTRKKFNELPEDIRESSFFKTGKNVKWNPDIKELGAARHKFVMNKQKVRRLSRSGTKPVEKNLTTFCRDMKGLFANQGKKPDYRLIAEIINLFRLSKKKQTYGTIRTRFSRDKI